MGIFDGIMDSVSSLGDSLDGLDFSDVAKAGLKFSKSKPAKNSESDYLGAYNMLARSEYIGGSNNQQPYSVRGMEASKSKPIEGVDPETLNQQWLRRLSRYTEIANSTGFPGGKART